WLQFRSSRESRVAMALSREALEAPMTLHWLASDLGVHMAPMLRVSRSMNQQMKSRLEHWRPAWQRQKQFCRILRLARQSAGARPPRQLENARQIQELAKSILRVLGADTFGHFGPTANGDLRRSFRSIAEAAQYATCHTDEQ
ncbi:unnamed protein product, partial [Effrenium voratum]